MSGNAFYAIPFWFTNSSNSESAKWDLLPGLRCVDFPLFYISTMPTRRNEPVTANGLLDALSFQLDHFLRFMEIDLTPAFVETDGTHEGPSVVELITHGENSRRWISQLQAIFTWSALAIEEEKYLLPYGLEPSSSHIRGVWSMPSFLRYIGRSEDHKMRNALSQGRKLRRFETKFGAGIALLMAPVLPDFRRLSLDEEGKTIELLKTHRVEFCHQAQRLSRLRIKYQKL